jgi:membrane-associated phospholipid phosphatase
VDLIARLAALDVAATEFLRRVAHTPLSERAAIAYAWAGEGGALWLAISLGGVALYPAQRARWFAMGAAAPAALLANYAVKLTVRRRRPVLDGLPALGRKLHTHSFPSGHAASSFAAAAAAPAWREKIALAATAMALTRPFLGVHYVSDVVAGALLGAAVGVAARRR